MITDRTSQDVINAQNLINTKIKKGIALTSETDIAQFNRGTCGIDMLNRVNTKITDLENQLNNLSYRVIPTLDTDSKTYSDYLSNSEYLNIFKNLDKLRNAFFVKKNTPSTPTYLYSYTDANKVEQILVDIEYAINDMKSKYRQCNTFQCGEINLK